MQHLLRPLEDLLPILKFSYLLCSAELRLDFCSNEITGKNLSYGRGKTREFPKNEICVEAPFLVNNLFQIFLFQSQQQFPY